MVKNNHSNSDQNSSYGHGSEREAKFCGCCHIQNRTRITFMLILTGSFFFVELITGHMTMSITLITDSFHMLSDSLALIISLIAEILSKRKSLTYDWTRSKDVGGLVNSVFLISLCLGKSFSIQK